MSVMPEIVAGDVVASKLKEIYFKDVPWSPKIATMVGLKLQLLKKIAIPFYPHLDIVGVLRELANYSQQDVEDAFLGDAQEVRVVREDTRCGSSGQPKSIGVHITRFMESS